MYEIFQEDTKTDKQKNGVRQGNGVPLSTTGLREDTVNPGTLKRHIQKVHKKSMYTFI